ncbi:Uncharacterized protein, DUF1810 family [Halopseudomonas litoralis]|uniref:Uncharacterized protein, DUF1810 family n=1 Tax=Halopseudomonas litoralis TaxID=797277 RepID=A0A1H1PPK2_9GAMM|nr:DUF1810 domain-containing protein [Halopseudomonas litoralis]SDS12679.1 Uncharacterized protein, DUF1810 family [Halopseudomonas litoralis]
MSDDFDLSRFRQAQETTYATALAELRAGHKRSHWIWFVFPQLRGLGRSATAERYGLTGLAEARAYLAHPLLGERLREAIEAMLIHEARGASVVLGELDAMKLRSCLTLFSLADPSEPLVRRAMEVFFGGQLDERTLKLLQVQCGN